MAIKRIHIKKIAMTRNAMADKVSNLISTIPIPLSFVYITLFHRDKKSSLNYNLNFMKSVQVQ